MPDYNPNSIWGSKEKKYVYVPPGEKRPASPSNVMPPPTDTASPLGGTPLGTSVVAEPKPPSFFRRHGLLVFTIGIFLAIGLAALIYYLLLPASAPNIAISFSNPGPIMIGEPFPVIITVSNESKSMIQNAQLKITLPSSSLVFASGTIPTQEVGMMSSGTINPPITIWLVATGSGGTMQTVNVSLSYQTATTASATFSTPAAMSLTIGSQSALSFSYSAPSSIFSGQNFDITVHYQNNTPEALQGVQFTMKYPPPPAYHFVTSSGTLPTGAENNIWDLGTVPANATGTLVITGNIVGSAQVQYPMAGTIGASFSGQNYPAYATSESFLVTPSPLSLAITLNKSSAYIAEPGDDLDYALTYTNNSNVTFQNVNISAVLTGQMYDFSSLKTDGSFNSQSDTITWFAADTPALASLAPGQSGTVTFTMNAQQAFPIKLLSDKDYSLNVTAKATSPTVPPNTAGANTTSVVALTNKVGGEIVFTANGYAIETTPGITNTGPYPPKVDQPTEYTIHWDITNYSTDATSVTVSAYLQSGTTLTGVATSTGIIGTSTPTYNAGTGLVTWTIPFIPATTGVISPPAQAIFQVTNTPAINEIGQTVTLLGPTTLTATDVYTGSTVNATAVAITTQLPNDPSASGQTGAVTQ